MKRALLKLCFLAGLVLGSPASAVTLSVSPSLSYTDPGLQFSVDIMASGLPANQVISAFNLMLGYDSTVMSAANVVFGSALGGPSDALTAFDPQFRPGIQWGARGYGTFLGDFSQAVQFR